MPFDPDVEVPRLSPGYSYSQGQVGGSIANRTIVNGGEGISATGTATVTVALALGELDTDGDGSGYVLAYEGGVHKLVDASLLAVGGAIAASSVTFTPAGGIAATDVQAALEELDTEKATVAQLGSYLTTADAATTYLTQANAASTYLTQANAATTYAPLASPALTGNPTAPTQSPGNNSTRLATTAYVEAAVAAGGGGTASSVTFSATGTIAATDVQAAIAEVADEAVQVAGDTMTGALILPAATTSLSPLRIPHGTAHSSPTNGDVWTTSTSIYARINGVTVDLAASGGAVTASGVTFSPVGTIAATDVQAAIAEAADEAVQIAGDTMTGQLILPAATTSLSPLRIPPGTAHSSPTNGDVWTTSAGLFVRASGATQQLAPLDSPTFTGSPAAPTAATGADNTQIATTAFVKAQAYATLASPTFTGNPLAPTPAVDDNDTSIATTAYVIGQAYGSSPAMDGSASAGSAIKWARGDHVHPSDTSRLALAGGTMTGQLVGKASNTTSAPINLPHGVAPTTPANGDIWSTSADGLVMRINGNSRIIATQSWVDSNYLDAVDPQPAGTMYFHGGVAAFAPINIDTSAPTNPTSPNNGDIWYNGGLKFREGGTTKTLATLESPTFSGTVSAPTPAPGTDSTVIPTTEFLWDYFAPLASPSFTSYPRVTAAAATEALFQANTSGSARWRWGRNSTAEGGSNAGSDFVLRAFDDSANSLGDAITVTRATLKTTFGGVVNTKTTERVRQAVNASASTTINRSSGDYVDLTLDENITTFAVSNWPASGTMGQVHLAITFTGAFTITWPSAVKWPGGTPPTLTGVNGKADHIMLVSDDGGTTIWGFVMGQNYDA